MRADSTPNPCVAARASPESFRRTRLKIAVDIQSSVVTSRCSGSGANFPRGVILSGAKDLCIPAGMHRPRSLRHGDKRAPAKKGRRSALCLLRLLFRLADRDGLARLTHLEPGETPHRDVLAQLAYLGRNQLRDRDRLILDKRLLVKADFFVELAHLTFD